MPPGGLFQFMRKTKKLRHQPETEGIYLDELKLDEMDPEVAALYLYGNKRCACVARSVAESSSCRKAVVVTLRGVCIHF